jgi:hypothetical protein
MRCHACGELLPLSARACHACGAPLHREPATGAADAAADLPERLQVAAGGAALLDRPFAAARPVQRLAPGTVVTVLGQQWGFIHAETADGRRGFVERAALVPLSPANEPRHPAASSPPSESGQVPRSGDVTAPSEGERREPAAAEDGLPFNIPFLEGEQVRYRAVFLYNPREDRALVVTNRRMIVTGGTFGSLPRVLPLEEIAAVQLRDSGSGSTNGEGNLYITLTGLPTPLHIGGVLMPHRVRDEILTACAERTRELSRGGRAGGRRAKG